MRVGSIGSSYVPKITAKRGQNAQTEKANPSFKADVRILPGKSWGPNEMPPTHAKQIIEALEHSQTAYKDLGSDNIFVYLKPCMDNIGGTGKKDIASSIEIYYGFKDIEVARKEILENREKDGYQKHNSFIEELKNRDPEAMERLKTVSLGGTERYKIKSGFMICSNLKKSLDETMQYLMNFAKYTVPDDKPKKIEFSEGYDPYTYEPDPWWIKAMG